MDYCLVCKEVVRGRYGLKVSDFKFKQTIKGHICRHCFNKFLESHYNSGYFKISRFVSWLKGKKDKFRH